MSCRSTATVAAVAATLAFTAAGMTTGLGATHPFSPLEPLPLGCASQHAPNTRYNFCSRLLVVPEHKFAFCYVEKVACTQFNFLMNALSGANATPQAKLWPWMRSSSYSMNVPMEDITRENGWYRGIFLRDPMERYVSAFQSKCVKRKDGFVEDYGEMCWPENYPDNRSLSVHSPAEERLAAFEESVRALGDWSERYEKEGNPHYELQRDMCGGLSSDLHEYDYVGTLGDYAHVQTQVRDMLSKAKVPFDEDLLTECFPASAPSKDHITEASDNVDFYLQNQKTKDLLKFFYARDYELLGLKLKR